jgi:hypothetical protein
VTTLADQAEGEIVTLGIERRGAATRVPVWFVVVDGEVFVRSYKGNGACWYRRASSGAAAEAAFSAGASPVAFRQVDDAELVARVTAEYLRKYARYDYVRSIAAPAAEAATLRLVELA